MHADATGNLKAVLGIRINPSSKKSSPFFDQFLSECPGLDSAARVPVTLDMSLALSEAGDVERFWTYKGSLTTPPCSEGLRWFVAKEVLEVSDAQLQSLLGVSVYSSRLTQEVWGHAVNEE